MRESRGDRIRVDRAGGARDLSGPPRATERLSHGAPAFFAGKQFVMLWADGHHEHQFPHLWCAAPRGAQESFIAADPGRYFRLPYVGSRGWLGMRLDGGVDRDEVAVQCEEAFRTVAPARLAAKLDDRPQGTGRRRSGPTG